MKPVQSDLEKMRGILALAEKAYEGCGELKSRGLIPFMSNGDPGASLSNAIRQMKELIRLTSRELKSNQ
jgi:hypothetical protein